MSRLVDRLRSLFSTGEVEQVRPTSGSPARGHHYFFAHQVLPAVFFHNPENFVSRLRREGDGVLLESWERVGRKLEDAVRVQPAGLTHKIRDIEGETTVVLITMPKPRVSPEAYCVAAVLQRASRLRTTTRFFTLESRQPGDGPEPLLCEWTPDERHRILGAVTGYDVEELLRSVRRVLTIHE